MGTDALTLDLPQGATAADALAALAKDHPPIAEASGTLAVAVNDRYCPASTVLQDGDTLALIPPVSGG